MQAQLLVMDTHPITGWKLINDRCNSWSFDDLKKINARKAYHRKKTREAKKNEKV
jgi:hypothetical protein